MSWNPVVTTEKDFPVAYGCEFTGSPPNVSTATLAFNYEFSVLNERGEDLRMVVIELRREMLPKLEVNFLYGLMEKTGLKECDFMDKQNIAAYAPSDESISFDPPPYVISLTSFAMDYIVPDESTYKQYVVALLVCSIDVCSRVGVASSILVSSLTLLCCYLVLVFLLVALSPLPCRHSVRPLDAKDLVL